jgi:isopenicillin N synthase-like dioxygenase
MFTMGEETMALSLEEKMKFEQGNSGASFGYVHSSPLLRCITAANSHTRYKCAGAVATDENGSPDTIESINVSRDDALAWPEVVHRAYPSTVNDRMQSTITPFMRKSIEINNTLLEALEAKLSLPKGILLSKHALSEHTSSEIRAIKAPKNLHLSNVKVSLDAHSDYGTIVCIFLP